MMDVTADHAMDPALAGLSRNRLLEVIHIADRPLDLELEELGQAPVRQAGSRTQHIEPTIRLERPLISRIPDIGQPFGALDDPIEQIAVNNP